MTGLYFLLGVSIGMWIVLGKVVFSEINKTYDRGGSSRTNFCIPGTPCGLFIMLQWCWQHGSPSGGYRLIKTPPCWSG